MNYTDQLARTIALANVPDRIVSVVPSQTEFLYDLGLEKQIVGQTIFCIHPRNKFQNATKIGGTKKLNLDKIRSLKPDIIIANKEENEESQIIELAEEFPVWISNIKTLHDAYDMMISLGKIFDKQEIAAEMVSKIKLEFQDLHVPKIRRKALYLIWREPWMAAGRDTFINHLLSYAGFENATVEEDSRYPELNTVQILALQPEYILLSSEPYPFKLKHIKELQDLLPHCKIILTDGELFSWYGSRLLKTPKYFAELIAK